jgi:hypothetical protein
MRVGQKLIIWPLRQRGFYQYYRFYRWRGTCEDGSEPPNVGVAPYAGMICARLETVALNAGLQQGMRRIASFGGDPEMFAIA